MVWEDVKKLFPAQWLLIEAVDAHTDGPRRIIEQVAVIESFYEDSKQALKNTWSCIKFIRIENIMWFTPVRTN